MGHLEYFRPNYQHYFGTVSPLENGVGFFSFKKLWNLGNSHHMSVLSDWSEFRSGIKFRFMNSNLRLKVCCKLLSKTWRFQTDNNSLTQQFFSYKFNKEKAWKTRLERLTLFRCNKLYILTWSNKENNMNVYCTDIFLQLRIRKMPRCQVYI